MVGIPKVMVVASKNGFWLPLLAASVIFGLISIIIVKLNLMFKGRTLYEYSREIIGGFGAVLISILFILYFFAVLLMLCIQYASTIQFNIMPNTPFWAELLIGMPVFGYIAYKGITNIARLTALISPLVIIVTLIGVFGMLAQGEFHRLLPLYVASDTVSYITGFKNAITPFLGMEILAAIPFTSKNTGSPKVAFAAFMAIGAMYILVSAGSIMMLGMNEVVYHADALIEATRLIEFKSIEFLQRVDIIYMTLGLMGMFTAKSVAYMVLVEFCSRLLPRVKRVTHVVVCGIVIFAVSTVLHRFYNIEKLLVEIIAYSGILTSLIIPGLLLIIAKVKKNAGKNF